MKPICWTRRWNLHTFGVLPFVCVCVSVCVGVCRCVSVCQWRHGYVAGHQVHFFAISPQWSISDSMASRESRRESRESFQEFGPPFFRLVSCCMRTRWESPDIPHHDVKKRRWKASTTSAESPASWNHLGMATHFQRSENRSPIRYGKSLGTEKEFWTKKRISRNLKVEKKKRFINLGVWMMRIGKPKPLRNRKPKRSNEPSRRIHLRLTLTGQKGGGGGANVVMAVSPA